jgi:hypothetical protein
MPAWDRLDNRGTVGNTLGLGSSFFATPPEDTPLTANATVIDVNANVETRQESAIEKRIRQQASICGMICTMSDASLIDVAFAMARRMEAHDVDALHNALAKLERVVRLDASERERVLRLKEDRERREREMESLAKINRSVLTKKGADDDTRG